MTSAASPRPNGLGLHHSFAEQLDGLYLPWSPPGFPEPQLLQLNEPLARQLGLSVATLTANGAAWLSASPPPPDARPLAQAYAGHQFGGFSPQLGDGRAALLGELLHDGARWDLALKGSGPTPFSRGGDGKATLGPILREYLISEAMAHLGVPTTRVLSCVATGERVWRGSGSRTGALPGAVLARVAASHLRVGTLQFFAARRDLPRLRRLVEYAVARHYPQAASAEGEPTNPALTLLNGVAEAQGRLIASWLLVGFVHGVMNTDNVTLSGETIDYGPCAFLDAYDPATVFSSIDHQGRYAYGHQPRIGMWNLARMGEALLPLLSADQAEGVALVEAALRRFERTHEAALLRGWRQKLGLAAADGVSARADHERDAADEALAADLLAWMHGSSAAGQDFTATFRALAAGLRSGRSAFQEPGFAAWEARWLARLGGASADHERIADAMDAVNPCYIPRNHHVEAALDAAHDGDLGPFETLLAVVRAPYEERPEWAAYAAAEAAAGPYRTFCGT